MLLLDMKTIFITLVAGHMFTVLLISAYWRKQSTDRTLTMFFLAKWSQAFAWLFLILQDGIPNTLSISLYNTLLFLGTSLEAIAVLKLMRVFTPSTKRYYQILTAGIIIVFHLVILLHNEENLRIAVASVGTAAFVTLPAYVLLRSGSMLGRIIGFLYAFVVPTQLARAYSALQSQVEMSVFATGEVQTVSFLGMYLLMIVGNTGFVLLLKERADEDMLRMVRYDDLTGIYNRRTFITNAEEAIAEHAKKGKPFTMVLFDIDHFKTINDSYGHHAGDQVLRGLSRLVNQQLGGRDSFGRYGGDEFAILLSEADEHEAKIRVEQIRLAAGQTQVPNTSVFATVSLGAVTIVPSANTKLDNLYQRCDAALYDSKRKGRNTATHLVIDAHEAE